MIQNLEGLDLHFICTSINIWRKKNGLKPKLTRNQIVSLYNSFNYKIPDVSMGLIIEYKRYFRNENFLKSKYLNL